MTKTGATTTNHKPKKVEAPIDYTQPLKNWQYEMFCLEYMKDGNGKRSAIIAEYSQKTAEVKASQLLRVVKVRGRLDYLQGEIAKECGVTVKQIVDEFKKIGLGKVSKVLNNRHKLQALENLGKFKGIYGKDNEQRQGLTLADIAALATAKGK